jgi:hypothetical protein
MFGKGSAGPSIRTGSREKRRQSENEPSTVSAFFGRIAPEKRLAISIVQFCTHMRR